ncbi:RNA polymerase sigma-70 factor, ECF subfamily [Alkalibacterium subtropicum]|uniref:RNA polymerase sigma-70 factor, ECF subfamily n=1 Tax=Alkalibacterium subtropicum TaxID=753702 RepID=A0A1I1JDM1_9LACT|nr:sigma-70 family RNA polymerase sigma factor [Alkalibacterium subtropicum]SFC46546.1 RNA polymerase sigma-70 factor, ECF subfamily [Alkalibacterium subtropicum]
MDKILKRAKKGDSQAFYTLFHSCEEDIYKMAYVYVNNQTDALDIVQETAYRSFKAVKHLKDGRYFKTWLIRITINCAIDHLRKNQRLTYVEPEKNGYYYQAPVHQTDLSLTLKSLISKLDEMEKSMVLLKYYEEYTFKEAAELLDIPSGTAKSILYRAIDKLGKDLQEEDFYE